MDENQRWQNRHIAVNNSTGLKHVWQSDRLTVLLSRRLTRLFHNSTTWPIEYPRWSNSSNSLIKIKNAQVVQRTNRPIYLLLVHVPFGFDELDFCVLWTVEPNDNKTNHSNRQPIDYSFDLNIFDYRNRLTVGQLLAWSVDSLTSWSFWPVDLLNVWIVIQVNILQTIMDDWSICPMVKRIRSQWMKMIRRSVGPRHVQTPTKIKSIIQLDKRSTSIHYRLTFWTCSCSWTVWPFDCFWCEWIICD